MVKEEILTGKHGVAAQEMYLKNHQRTENDKY